MNFGRLVIQKTVVGVLIGLAVRVIAIKTITTEGLFGGAIDIDQDDICRQMPFMRQDTMVLQIAVVGPKTGYLESILPLI